MEISIAGTMVNKAFDNDLVNGLVCLASIRSTGTSSLSHIFSGMDIHYMAPSDESLKNAMDKYTRWLDEKIAEANEIFTKALTKNKNSSQVNL